jgi:hypothetical protein
MKNRKTYPLGDIKKMYLDDTHHLSTVYIFKSIKLTHTDTWQTEEPYINFHQKMSSGIKRYVSKFVYTFMKSDP